MDYRLFLLAIITNAPFPALCAYDNCNQTISSTDSDLVKDSKVTLKLPSIKRTDRNKPFYCKFRFEGQLGQIVQIDVRDVRAGLYNNKTKQCEGGYLRISDNQSCSTNVDWLPPTTLCQPFEKIKHRVRRLTKSSKALVEFKLDNAKTSKGFELDVTFVNKDTKSSLPYGDLWREDGHVKGTKCDWVIPVDNCFGFCRVISPGYPGIYAPNIRCRYLFTNFDDERVELKLGGKGLKGKFDMKESENCSADYVDVYDGTSTVHPKLARFCGQEGAHLISSGSSLLLIFQTSSDSPPWDYSGFDIQTTHRWANQHEGGEKIDDSDCNWLFKSQELMNGDVHTPDYMIDKNTTCSFKFVGEYYQKLEIRIKLRHLAAGCAESLTVFDGDKERDIICDGVNQKEMAYNSTGPSMTVKYVKTERQISNPTPTWISYRFFADPDVEQTETSTNVKASGHHEKKGAHNKYGSLQVTGGGESGNMNSGNRLAQHSSVLALSCYILCVLHRHLQGT